MTGHLAIKRVYEPFDEGDGFRVLVDRLWPRGLRKAGAHIDYWARDIAPSRDLRRWFGHDPEKWPEFRQRYGAELRENGAEWLIFRAELARHGEGVTLLYAARDPFHNHALLLRDYLRNSWSDPEG